MTRNKVLGSFRDPSGFVFIEDGKVFRQVNNAYRDDYDLLMKSGLYDSLTGSGLMITHGEVTMPSGSDDTYKIIRPEKIDFISYPYEWSFSQLKDAALTTLEIQKRALEYGMSLKDSSAYNIQFFRGRPVLMDTLSFERYKKGKPWAGYRQFCQHFLAPLALTSRRDARLSQLHKTFLDGIPLDLAGSLLPKSTYLEHGLLIHIHLHSKSQKHFSGRGKTGKSMGLNSLKGLVDSLESAVRKLHWKPKSTVWSDYYGKHINYDVENKKRIVREFLDKANPKSVWDLGANVGIFSRISSGRGIKTIAFDIDPACVEVNYLEAKKNDERNILPLVMDLTNPTPSLGWNGEERMSFMDRGPADTILSLALIHHLAIANNVPLERIASFYKNLCDKLIIEFIPKNDSNVQRLLSGRDDIFREYDAGNFEKAFGKHFRILEKRGIENSKRTLYLMVKK